jgi:protein kinase C substrate 80K-H
MKFEKGTKCWNGPARSLTVEVSCGAEDEILTVEEPDTCRYVATMTSPAACA